MRRVTRKRATRQLEAVFQALQGDPTHPFADEIYRRVRKKLPRISLATVYRNLQRLVEDGRICTGDASTEELRRSSNATCPSSSGGKAVFHGSGDFSLAFCHSS